MSGGRQTFIHHVRARGQLSEGLTGADIDGAARDAVAATWMLAASEGTKRSVGMTDLLIALQTCHVDGRLKNRIGDLIEVRWREALDLAPTAAADGMLSMRDGDEIASRGHGSQGLEPKSE